MRVALAATLASAAALSLGHAVAWQATPQSVARSTRRQLLSSLRLSEDNEGPTPGLPSFGDDEEDPYLAYMESPGMQDVGGAPKVLRSSRQARKKRVPLDQQPYNELQYLKDAPMFGWAQQDLKGFALRLGSVYACAALVSLPIARVTFVGDDQLAQVLLASNIGALGVVTALVLRLYSGWDYVAQRLDEDVVAYEETGWYDGSSWAKPPDVQARDQMLNMYEVQPVLKRLRATLALVASLFALTTLGYRTLVPNDPYEMYQTSYLKDLPANEWKASETAKAAGSKPAYCDSRYYKALAGGNGCD